MPLDAVEINPGYASSQKTGARAQSTATSSMGCAEAGANLAATVSNQDQFRGKKKVCVVHFLAPCAKSNYPSPTAGTPETVGSPKHVRSTLQVQIPQRGLPASPCHHFRWACSVMLVMMRQLWILILGRRQFSLQKMWSGPCWLVDPTVHVPVPSLCVCRKHTIMTPIPLAGTSWYVYRNRLWYGS